MGTLALGILWLVCGVVLVTASMSTEPYLPVSVLAGVMLAVGVVLLVVGALSLISRSARR